MEKTDIQDIRAEYFFFPFLLLDSDYILRGPELSGPLIWVWFWLPWHEPTLYPLQLHQGGEWLLGALREAQLHRLPVRPDQRRVPWQAALDGLQRHHPLLPYLLLCEVTLRAQSDECFHAVKSQNRLFFLFSPIEFKKQKQYYLFFQHFKPMWI